MKTLISRSGISRSGISRSGISRSDISSPGILRTRRRKPFSFIASEACAYLYVILFSFSLSQTVQAEINNVTNNTTNNNSDLLSLQKNWAQIQYSNMDDDAKEQAFEKLDDQATILLSNHPGQAEYLTWRGIIRSTHAGVDGGLGALSLAKAARKDFTASIELNETVLDGAALTSLGALYYQVPGWPLAFGDDEKAGEFLKRGLAMNPAGIDANYFYGDYLISEGDNSGALVVLKKALAAPDRKNRPLADEGRRREIQSLIEELK